MEKESLHNEYFWRSESRNKALCVLCANEMDWTVKRRDSITAAIGYKLTIIKKVGVDFVSGLQMQMQMRVRLRKCLNCQI